MTELLNVGKRIKRFRILCGMTQKALGMAVGFPQETADVRIAQYESGARTPKRKLLCQMARVLGVSPSALAVPRIKNSEELYCLLRALEDECGIKLSPQSDTAAAIYESHRERSKGQ
jgi:transcriptional regulator with XRE-family HTH domain